MTSKKFKSSLPLLATIFLTFITGVAIVENPHASMSRKYDRQRKINEKALDIIPGPLYAFHAWLKIDPQEAEVLPEVRIEGFAVDCDDAGVEGEEYY